MRLVLYILATLLLALPFQAVANPVDVAQNLAKRYCKNPSLRKTGAKPTSELRSALVEEPSYFIFSDDASSKFCIVSADGDKVLGFGDNYSDELPPQLQSVLDTYAISQHPISELRNAKVREDIPAFMDVVYGTRSPYNIYIPRREGSGPPVGCVPVVMAQICKYYEYPSKLLDDIPSYGHYSAIKPDSLYIIEEQKAEGRTYDWSLILNHYEKDTTEVLNNEIAKLMWDCARSVETKFEQSGSAAPSKLVPYSMSKFFGYNSDSMKCLTRSHYYKEDWLDIIHEELSKKRPIYMSGSSYSNGGHAFVCDGFVDGYLHINWGWNGSFNGYFDIDILDYKRNRDFEQTNPDNGYSFYQSIIIGIVPGEGNTKYERPQSSSSIVHFKNDSVSFSTRYRATDNGFMIYPTVNVYKKKADKSKRFTLGYADMNDKILFMENGESDYFTAERMTLKAGKEFDSSYLGKELTLFVLESDSSDIETLIQDSIYEWWQPSNDYEPIIVKIPESIDNSHTIIEPTIDFMGDYAGSAITLNIEFQAERPEGCMRYYSLGLVVDDDTLMSKFDSDFRDDDKMITFTRVIKNPDMDKEMTLIVLQTDDFSHDYALSKSEWTECKNYEPVSFKLSDCVILAKEVIVDTVLHTTMGRKHRFEITFTNPTPFEFYDGVYLLVEEDQSGIMLDIPAGETKKIVFEHELPLLTKYINSAFGVFHNNIIAELEFTKDTFSHVFYGMGVVDENTVGLEIWNATNKTYENTFKLRLSGDSVNTQEVTIKPDEVARLNYSLPVIKRDTDIIQLNRVTYTIFDQDNTNLGKVNPLPYYGKITQSFDEDSNKIISIRLIPNNPEEMSPIIVGVSSLLENAKAYERLKYTPAPNESSISVDFKLSDYYKTQKPKYIGLCKKDGTFYAYMELTWDDQNSVEDIPANALSIIAVDGGFWISSDVDIPSLPIYNMEGKLIKTVEMKSNSTLFVPLGKGIYLVGNKKVIINS
ncbi:MAG: C10 family peptidase [Paludibacteraceae bacterium]|nr:C10 family peptidase [Paludibacteraceae bacterium]